MAGLPATCSPAVSRCCWWWPRSSAAARSGGGRGGARERTLAVTSWRALASTRSAAAGFEHLLAMDPPAGGGGPRRAQRAAARVGPLGLGRPSATSPLAHWRSQLALRAGARRAWRALCTQRRCRGEELRAALQGAGAYSRDGALCGRLVRVLTELELVSYDPEGRECRVSKGRRTDLSESAAFGPTPSASRGRALPRAAGAAAAETDRAIGQPRVWPPPSDAQAPTRAALTPTEGARTATT